MSTNSAVLLKRAVEYHPPISKRGVLERLFTYWFDGLVYNQIWEDPVVDMAALEIDSESRLLTISSGGCNLLNYLTANPHVIHAVDLNPYHLNLTRLKLAAYCHLPSYEDVFQFWGCANHQENLKRYQRYLRDRLDRSTRDYWESQRLLAPARIRYFTKNLYNFGAMGYFIRFVHAVAWLFSCRPERLLEAMSQTEREMLFEREIAPFFHSKAVRWLGSLPIVFYSLGIPPQQFRELRQECQGNFGALFCERIKRLACDFPIEDNYFAWQAFARKYDTVRRKAVPYYLQQERYSTIKYNLPAIHLHHTSTTLFLKQQPNQSLNRFIFLDSQDWMSGSDIAELWTEVARTGTPGSRIIFRTGGNVSPVERSLPPSLLKRFTFVRERSQELFKQDRSAIYGGFYLYILND